MPPSGIEMNSIPPAMMNEFFTADQKSGSAKMKRKPSTPSVLFASKNGAVSRLWNRMKPSGSATAMVSTATTIQRSMPASGCRPLAGSAGIASPGPVVRATAGVVARVLVESMSTPLRPSGWPPTESR